MNLKLTLLLTAAAVSSAAVVDAAAVAQEKIIVAQQQQNENQQQRRERQEQRKDQRQDQRQEQRQERRQQSPNNAQNQQQNQQRQQPNNAQNQQERKQQPANNQQRDERRQDNKDGKSNTPAAGNQERNRPAQQPAAAPPKPLLERNTNAPKNDNRNDNKNDNKPAAQQNTAPNKTLLDRERPNQNRETKSPAGNQQPKTAEPAKPADRDTRPKRLDAVKAERKETKEGDRTIIKENNRTIIKENNTTIIRHDDTERYRRLGGNVQVQHRGNITENVIVRPGGVRIVERFDERGRLIRRSRFVNGREIVLINNHYRPGADFTFIVRLPPPVIHIPRERYIVEYRQAPRAWIYETLIAPPVEPISQHFTLDEIRYNAVVRERMPRIDIDTINFESGSWDVSPDQAQLLAPIAEAMRQAIEKNPEEVYLVEGHTDAVGSPEDNLSLSDRRAEAVAEVLTAQFNIPPENLVTQGYGEQNLKVETQGPDPRNRYVTVRRITPLLAQQ